jgi:hypothetical protein
MWYFGTIISNPSHPYTCSQWGRRGITLLENLRSQGDDLHKPLGPKFPGNRTENSGSHRISLGIDEDSGVVIKLDVGTVGTFHLFPRPDNDSTSDIPFSNLGIGKSIFDGNNNDVSQGGILPTGAAEDFDTPQSLGSRIVGDLENTPHLNHDPLPFESRKWRVVGGK